MPGLPFSLKHPSGLEVRGDIHLPAGEGRAPAVILCHGFKGFKDWGFFPYVAERLAEAGFAAIRMNFSLNGIGEDPIAFTELDRFAANTLSQELNDLDLVIQAARQGGLPGAERLDRRRMALVGHSRGGGIALLRALEDTEVRAVVTWASVSSFWEGVDPDAWRKRGFLEILNTRTNQVMKVGYGAWEDYVANRERFDLLKRLPVLRARTLFLHGRKDPSVPCAASERLARWMGDRGVLHLLPEADHVFGASMPFRGSTPELDEALRLSVGFLREQV
jgi:dienelactone hydrolase